MRKKRTVAVAGGFDPLNGRGHISHIQEAKKLGDRLVVILARDDQMAQKKGSAFYISYKDREMILREMRSVDEVVMNVDKDISCAETLKMVKPDVFAKGGDRGPDNLPESELEVCRELGIELVFNVGLEKETSSQTLIRKKCDELA